MRLRTFTGHSTAEAMAAVRAALGPDAVIVSAQDDGNGNTRVTAALDEHDHGPDIPAVDAVLGEALDFHGASSVMRAWIVNNALQSALEQPAEALASGLGHSFRFAPITAQDKAILLVGAPGAGKTVTAAKLATRDVLAGKRVRLISTDLARAGGVAQLEAFAKILGVRFATADSPAALDALVALADPKERLIIDTASVNPFGSGDRRDLAALIGGTSAHPMLVFAAGADAADGIERAEIFADLGCSRAIVTQIDAARRLGSVLAMIEAAKLSFAEAGIAADIADGLMPFTPALLARLLLPKSSP
ncbi:MAG TPA: GTP-binding protein [Stellaceae bacterium]|jgi:flagellar biosynthesis protein FlhF